MEHTIEFMLTKAEKRFKNFVELIDYQNVLYAFGNAVSRRCSSPPLIVSPSDPVPAVIDFSASGLWAKVMSKSVIDYFSRQRTIDEIAGWTVDGTYYITTASPMTREGAGESPSILKPKDSARIAASLRKQAQMLEDAGTRAIFFVVPRYYSEQTTPTAADAILAEAFRLAPEIRVLDTSGTNQRADMFIDPTHPSAKFFRELLEQAVRRGWLERPAAGEYSPRH